MCPFKYSPEHFSRMQCLDHYHPTLHNAFQKNSKNITHWENYVFSPQKSTLFSVKISLFIIIRSPN